MGIFARLCLAEKTNHGTASFSCRANEGDQVLQLDNGRDLNGLQNQKSARRLEPKHSSVLVVSSTPVCSPPPGGIPYNGLYGEAPPERGTFFVLRVYKRVGISQVKVSERVCKTVI